MIRALSGSPPSIRLASPQIEGNERSVVELDEETMKEETNEHRKNYYESVGIHSFSVEGVEKYLVLFEVHSGSDCTLSATLNKNASEEDSDALESETEKDRADDDILEKEDFETPSEKRIHLAKEYLSTISKEEAAGDLENSRLTVHERISHRLKREQEEKDRKVTKTLAHLYTNAFEESKVLTLKGHRLPVTCAIISSDEKYIYSGSKDSTIIKWSAKSGRKICRIIGGKKGKAFGGHTKEILALALSTDGKYLASGGKEDVIFIWNAVNNCELLHVFKGHRGPISSLAFRSGSNTLYSASFDRTIKIWDVDSFLFIEQLFGHQDSVMCVDTLSRDRAISVGGRDRSLRLWKISEESQLVFDSKGHVGNIECCCMINENTFVTCGEDGKIFLWTTSRRRPFFTQTSAHGMRHSKSENTHNHNNKANAPWVTSVASYRYSDLLASGSNTGFIKLWRLEPNKTLSSISDLPCVGYVNSLQFSASGTILVASVAQEHRLGRWEKLKNVKNCVKVFYLNPH
ncbi:hypothetical protein Zmor_016368 [Zophobas morio]|uniref:U3 small nucleolar RNA-interacting protein 2 n=1 Tax=Zophobas morio TaxID=2755281 RepID=A0AA38HGD7_9CUCU|nr:hypothetical protein Zmor_016368 [Zophobas morio]